MESYRKRVLIARLLLVASGVLVLSALLPPWMVFRLSGFAHGSSAVVDDVTIRLWQVLRENAVKAADNFFGTGWQSGFGLLIWTTVFAFLFSSPFLVAFYSMARALLWVARGMAVALCLPLIMMIYVAGQSNVFSAGTGMWLFQAAAIIHALGLFLIPKLPRAVEPAQPES